MVDTIPANTSTFATVSVNGFVYDTIETVGDVDWYKVTLSAGHYHINLGGDPLFGNALADTLLTVYNSAGTQLRLDDDNGADSNSYIDFNAPSSGTYYIAAAAWGSYTGDYLLSVLKDDIPASNSLPNTEWGLLYPGGSVTGSSSGDLEEDRYKIVLKAGVTYEFKIESQAGGINSRSDPLTPQTDVLIQLFDASGQHATGYVNSALARFSYTAPASGWYTVGAGSYDSDFGYYSLSVTAPSASLEQNLRPSGGDQSVATAEDTAVKPGPIVFSDADGDFLRGILIVSLPAAGTLTVAGTPAAIGQVVLAYDLKDLLWTPPANAYGSNLASFTFEVIDDGFGRRPATDQSPNTITFNVTPVNDAPVIMSGGGGEATGVVVAENSTGVTSVQAVDVDTGVSYAISGADAGLFVVDAATGAVSFRAAPDFELPAAGRNTYAITLLATDGALTDTQALTVTVANAAGNTIIGTKKANTVDASHAIKSLAATGEEDYIDGKKGNDKLNGLGGNDTLIGGAGRDALTGAAGWDRLDGGKDADRFVFSTKFDGSADLIVKFEHDKDEIALKKGVVKAIGSSLSDGEFYAKAGAVKAHDKSDHIIYNKTTGDLYYDKDGKGHTAAIHFATLGNHPGSLDHGDFVIV